MGVAVWAAEVMAAAVVQPDGLYALHLCLPHLPPPPPHLVPPLPPPPPPPHPDLLHPHHPPPQGLARDAGSGWEGAPAAAAAAVVDADAGAGADAVGVDACVGADARSHGHEGACDPLPVVEAGVG